MTTGSAPSTDYTPVFDWGTPPRRRLWLFTFVAASAVLHALCFYLFQIVYPLTVALLPPPARVSLITADSETGRLLLRWVEAEDPALSSLTQRPPGAESSLPPAPAHVPSYARHQPALKPLPSAQPDLRIPRAHPPAPVSRPRPAPPLPAAPVSSRLLFAPTPESLGPAQVPELKFTASRNDPPEAAQFRIGIDARGTVRHCFLQTSSGDSALDEQARRLLLLCRFPQIENRSALGGSRMDEALLWTTAAFQWGNDLTLPAPKPESPTP